jgi:hypothetical protein
MSYFVRAVATVLLLLFTALSGRADQAKPASSGGSAASPHAAGVSPADLLTELVDLKKQGFATDLLVQYVSQKTLSSAMTAKDLSQWKQSGMPPEVIKAALGRWPGAASEARPAAAPYQATTAGGTPAAAEPGSHQTATPAGEQCQTNFVKEGSFFKGTTYRSHADYPGTREAVFEKTAQSLATQGWQITSTNKDIGLVTATQQAVGGGRNSQLNVVVKPQNDAVRVEVSFSLGAMMKTRDDSVRDGFCKILTGIGP